MIETQLPEKSTISKHEILFPRGFTKFEFSFKNLSGTKASLEIRLLTFGIDPVKPGKLARNSSVSLIIKDQSNNIVMHKLIQEMSGASDNGFMDETASVIVEDEQTVTLKGFVYPSSEQSTEEMHGSLEAKLIPMTA